MINTKHLLRVGVAWVSIVYAVCFVGVALMPGIRSGFMRYGLHVDINIGENILTFGAFISGLIIWNVIAFLAIGLFVRLFNSIKK
jgi:uncharacterized membrane protein